MQSRFGKLGYTFDYPERTTTRTKARVLLTKKRYSRDFVDSYFEPGTYVIVDVFADDGLTGTDTARPNFKRLEGALSAKK